MEHPTTSDSQLVKTMGLVMGALVLFFIVIVAAANFLVDPLNTSPNSAKLAAMQERTTPVGVVRTSADEVESATVVAQVDAAPKTGEQLAASCLACHSAATAAALNAPAIGDAAAWNERLSAGLDALVNSAINGKGAMPPRGGSALSDDEIRLAVEYLAGQ